MGAACLVSVCVQDLAFSQVLQRSFEWTEEQMSKSHRGGMVAEGSRAKEGRARITPKYLSPQDSITFSVPSLQFQAATSHPSRDPYKFLRVTAVRVSLAHWIWRKWAPTTHQQEIHQDDVGQCSEMCWHSPTSWGTGLAGTQNFVTAFPLSPTRLPQCTHCLLRGPVSIKLHKALPWGSKMDCLISLPLFISLICKTPFLPRIILPKGQVSCDHFSQLLIDMVIPIP